MYLAAPLDVSESHKSRGLHASYILTNTSLISYDP